MINVEQLEQFVVAAELLNFSQTAQVFHASTSTISRNIALLEKYLDTVLFLRHDRSLTLTYAGQVLLESGLQLLDNMREMEAAVRSAGTGQRGTLRLAVQNLGDDPILDFIADFKEQFPEIELQTRYLSLPQIFQRLDSGQADLTVAFAHAVPNNYKNYDTYALHRDDLVIAAPRNHPLAARTSVRAEELAGEDLLWLRQYEYPAMQSISEDVMRELVPEYSRDRNRTMPLLLQDLYMSMRIGRRLAVVPRQLFCQLAEGVSMLEIEDVDTSFELIALWKTVNRNPSLQLFLEELFRAFP